MNPPVLTQRTRAVAAELARTRTALNTHFDELLALQDRVLRLELLVENVLNDRYEVTQGSALQSRWITGTKFGLGIGWSY